MRSVDIIFDKVDEGKKLMHDADAVTIDKQKCRMQG